ncbi:MAG: hypothetical protein WD928_10600 [Gammaproteobacteria bacterium]
MNTFKPTIPSSWAIAAVVVACAAAPAAAQDCSDAEDPALICGFERPEDIERLAAGRALLISEYGGLSGSRPGRLTVYQPADDSRRELYPANGSQGRPDWGSADCPGAPGAEFSPHGIHLATVGGAQRVLAVNHGGREAIELFELRDASDPNAVNLRWRGCIIAPEGAWLNDVVGLPDGGLAATHMVERGTGEEALLESERRRDDIGHVLGWMPDSGWRVIPGSQSALPNGIEVSADGTVLYINEYFGDRVYALERASGRRLWQTAVDAPDNSSWGDDGRLLVTSHHDNLQAVFACNAAPLRPCALRYAIVAIDPENGNRLTVVEGGDALFGAATVAVELGERLYLGSFVGDRMATIRRGSGVHP